MKGKKTLALILSAISITSLLYGCGDHKNLEAVPEENINEISEDDYADSDDSENSIGENREENTEDVSSESEKLQTADNADNGAQTKKPAENTNTQSSKKTTSQNKTVLQTKVAQSSNSSKAANTSSSKSTEVKSETNTTVKAKDDSKPKQGGLVYKSNLGFAITFPESWRGKYIVTEDGGEVRVSFKSSDPVNDGNSGWMFSIDKKDAGVDTEFLDSINGRRSITVDGKEYIVGGPTGLTVNPECSDFKQFQDMRNQMGTVLDSVKSC